jgi:hypothetical protein
MVYNTHMENEFDNYDEADAYAYDDTHFSEDSTDWDDISDADEDAFTSMGWGMDESYGNYNEEW